MKFTLWMIVSHIILLWLIAFPDVVPRFLQWYGFLFCMFMFVVESKIYLDKLFKIDSELEEDENGSDN